MSKCKSIFNLGDKLPSMRGNDKFLSIYSHYQLLAKNRFKWDGLPDGIESRHIERAIYEYGMAIAFEDEIKGLTILPCQATGRLNPLGDSLEYQPISFNGEHVGQIIKAEDCVVIRENDDAIPLSLTVFTHCARLAEIERTMDINLKQQRKPYIISVTENNKLSMDNMYKKIEKGEEAIFVDKRKTEGGNIGIEVLQTNSEYLLDRLSQFADKKEYKLLSLLGINNIEKNKKERMITDEVNANNSNILFNLDLGYKTREKARQQINDKFKTNITLEKTINTLENDFKGEPNEKKPMENLV